MNDILPGQLVYVFGASILDAALLSWLALRWYRRSVRRLMREGGTSTAPLADEPREQPAAPPPGGQGFRTDAFALAEVSVPTTPSVADRRPGDMTRVIVAYVLGALAFAAVITTLKFSAESRPLPAVAWFVDWWMNTWPIVPTLVALLVLDRRQTARLAIVYVLGGAAAICVFTIVVQVLRGALNTAPLTNMFWALVSLAWAAWIPLALIAFTGWRRVRAVLPLVLAATLLFGFGSLLFRELLIRALNVEAFRSAFLSGAVFFSVSTVQYALFMIASLPVGWLAWRLLIALADGFARKRFSDIQLVVDCWWAIVAAEITATSLSITYGIGGIAGGAAAFLAYRISVSAALRAVPSPAAPRRLLLLRVFGYQARTESLFDRVAQAWRFHGPVQLIAGVDLAMRTADPGDLLAMLNGRLAESYVPTPEDVPGRLQRLDLHPDPDGRFRINEVYCRDHTWRPTLQALLEVSDRVLMDLRSFSTGNAGCRFELEQLLRRLSTNNVILVCDKTTDLPLLREILTEAWTAACRDGCARGDAAFAVVRVERQSRRELGLLMDRLLAGSQPASAPV